MRWLSLFCIALFPFSRVSISEESADVYPELEAALQDWETLRATASSGEMVWQLQSRTRSSGFGSSSPHENESSDADSKEIVRVRFDQHSLRLEGAAEPTLRLGRAALPDSETWVANQGFHENLVSGKLPDVEGDFQPIPYLVHVNRQHEVHLWTNPLTNRPCRVLFPAGASGPLIYFDAQKTGQLPAIWGLIAVFRLALQPDTWRTAEFAVPDSSVRRHPLMEGRRCLAVEFPLPNLSTTVFCRLVIDPSRGNSILRAIFRNAERAPLVQYDIDYDADELGRWWPQSVTIVQFNSFGDPYDELYLVRTGLKVHRETPTELASMPAAEGTCVVDLPAGESYIVAKNGHHRAISLSKAAALLGSTDKNPLRFGPDRRYWSVKTVAVRLVTWPWILLTIAVVYACAAFWKLGRQSYRPDSGKITEFPPEQTTNRV